MKLNKRQKNNFMKKVETSSGCWNWSACINNGGYGRVNIDYKTYLAHRISWLLFRGSIPVHNSFHGMCILHKCDNRKCVNPNHLFIGTQKDNIEDAYSKGRRASYITGEKNPKAKINKDIALKIRDLSSSMSVREITQKLNVSEWITRDILTGRTWRHI